jgi:hypothetical protein
MSTGSMGQILVDCGIFFSTQTTNTSALTPIPIRSVKQKSNFNHRNMVISSGKALTPLQWNCVIETAEVMAAEDL